MGRASKTSRYIATVGRVFAQTGPLEAEFDVFRRNLADAGFTDINVQFGTAGPDRVTPILVTGRLP